MPHSLITVDSNYSEQSNHLPRPGTHRERPNRPSGGWSGEHWVKGGPAEWGGGRWVD